MANYFAFIDESGNSNQERFFGLGLLIINNDLGDFYDEMKSFYDKVADIARNNKLVKISELRQQGDNQQLAEIAKSSKRFELKFKYINSTNNLIYKSLITKYFSFLNTRFCALVIDRNKINPYTKNDGQRINPWDAYIQQAAMLIANNLKNIFPCKICVLADDLSRPSTVKKSFENSLADSIRNRLDKKGMNCEVFGVSRLESHASLMIQIVDILLGCVMYDYKKPAGLVSIRLAGKQEIVVSMLRNGLGTKSLAQNKTYHKPNYFSVWELEKKQ